MVKLATLVSVAKRFFPSLREYLQELKHIGELVEVNSEVDWKLEMGAIIRRSYELQAPAPLFNNVHGIETGFRVLGAPAGVSRKPGLYLARVALSLGLTPEATGKEIVESLVAARKVPGVRPKRVASGPCRQNIWIGNDVDLLRFPTPLIHAAMVGATSVPGRL